MTVQRYNPQNDLVTLTDGAVRHFEAKLTANPGKLIRFSTKESGCTGFSYIVDYAEHAEPEDVVLQISNIFTLAIAKNAVDLVRKTEIDYVQEGLTGMLKFNNPNVSNTCGCGESFSVQS